MNNTIAIVKTNSNPSVAEVREKVKELLQYLGGWKRFIKSGARVLIKPNVGVVAESTTARNTDPRLVHAVILELKEYGVSEILVGESSIVGVDTTEAFRLSGIEQVAKDTGVKLVNLKEEYKEVPVPNPIRISSIRIAKKALEVDAIINLPKLKTICATPISLGMKNLKGLLPDEEKRRFHYTNLNEALVDLNKVVKPALTIIDGIIASEMYKPKEVNVLLAGSNTVTVDSIAARIINVDPRKVKYLSLASELNLGYIDLQKIKIKGCSIEETFKPLIQAPDVITAFTNIFPEVKVIEGGACSGCIGTLYLTLENLKANGLLNRCKNLTIAVGPKIQDVSDINNTIFLGNCLRQYKDKRFAKGCPFIFSDFINLIKDSGN